MTDPGAQSRALLTMRVVFAVGVGFLMATPSSVAAQAAAAQPIIDVNVNTSRTSSPFAPSRVCAPVRLFLPRDPAEPYSFDRSMECDSAVEGAGSAEAHTARTLAIMNDLNITAVLDATSLADLRAWKARAPNRIIGALGGGRLDSLRKWKDDGLLSVIGEVNEQYHGRLPTDSLANVLFTDAEQLDLPLTIHMGAGPPAATAGRLPKFRMALGAPILLEEMLAQHPTVRVDVVQAGWPNLDQMVALLYAYPQVYVDVSFIDWFIPRAEFYEYLKRLTDAGLGKRIMFGSNQSSWPDVIPIAVRAITDAPFLTPEQKRDILYNNAARFLRLPGNLR